MRMRNKTNSQLESSSYERKGISKSLVCLGILIIAVNFGSVLNYGEVNPSWIVAIVCCLIFLIEKGKSKFLSRYSSINRLVIFMLFWVAYATIQLIYVGDIEIASQFYRILNINVFLVIYMLLTIKTRQDICYILDIFSISFFINILAAYWEYFSGSRITALEDSLVVDYQGKVGGFIGGNINDFCAFLFIAIVVFIIQLTLKKGKFKQLAYLVGIMSSIFFIFINGSRGGIYGVFILGILIIVFLLERKIFKKKVFDNIFITSFLILFCVIIAVQISMYGLSAIISHLGTSGDYESDLWRANAIIRSVEAFVNSYGFGIGAGQTIPLLGMNVHNFYIEIITEYGLLVGIGAIYISFILPIKRSKIPAVFMDALIRATAFALILINITSSSTNKMRALWILITLIYIIKTTDIFSINDTTKQMSMPKLIRGR